MNGSISWNDRLRRERISRNWRQQDLAEQLGTTVVTIQRWERGKQQPSAYYRIKLCKLFGKTAEELGLLDESQFSPPVPIEDISAVGRANAAGMETLPLWTVPFARNPYFTGRDELLERLHSHLSPQKLDQQRQVTLTQTQALSGLGGIGKTQLAIEYAYRYVQEYTAVFWIGAETAERLVSSFVTLAETLNLPERLESNQQQVVSAVLRWLRTHQGWLLIFDNVEELELVKPFVPTVPHGSILFTTRLQALGNVAQQIMVETMGLVEGTAFLLYRAKLLPASVFLDQISPELLAEAESLVIELDFLPLAIDQAGAYIEEVGCSPATYLKLYHRRRRDLLQRRGHTPSDHPDSVATTWSLSFQRIEHRNPAAADLLRMCAFLEPDAIPEELLQEGCLTLGSQMQAIATDMLAFHAACEELARFSLVQRDPQARLLRIHRLVQAVLKDNMEVKAQERWVEHMLRTTERVFPATVDATTWSQCQRVLPQAQMGSLWAERLAVASPQAASLLLRTAQYLRDVALYEQAERLSQQVLAIHERMFKQERLEMAQSLHALAEVHRQRGNYAEAEPLYQRALAVWEQHLGPDHPQVAHPLNGLAILYGAQGKYAEAELLYQRALHIREQHLGPDHPDVAQSFTSLALLYYEQGNYAEVEPLYQRALAIYEQRLGPDHPQVASPLSNLALLYWQQGRYAEAEPLYQRAISIYEQRLGPDHPQVASPLNGLATLYGVQGNYTKVEPLLQRVLAIWEQHLGPDHPQVAHPLNNLAFLYSEQGKYAEAEPLFQRALAIWEQRLGPDHPLVAHPLNSLGELYSKQSNYTEAEPLYQRALRIRKQHLSPEHPDTAETLHDLAMLREKQGNFQEALALYRRALAIREQALGSAHSKTAETRTCVINLLHAMGQHEEAALLEAVQPGTAKPENEQTRAQER